MYSQRRQFQNQIQFHFSFFSIKNVILLYFDFVVGSKQRFSEHVRLHVHSCCEKENGADDYAFALRGLAWVPSRNPLRKRRRTTFK